MKNIPPITIDREVIIDNFRKDIEDLQKEQKEILGRLAAEGELEKGALQSSEGAEQLKRYVSIKKRQLAILNDIASRFPEDYHLYLEMHRLVLGDGKSHKNHSS